MENQHKYRLLTDEAWAESCLDWRLRLLKLLIQIRVAGYILSPRDVKCLPSIGEFGVCVCVRVCMCACVQTRMSVKYAHPKRTQMIP